MVSSYCEELLPLGKILPPVSEEISFESGHEISFKFDILTSVDSDEPLQPPYKLRNSKWCSVSSFSIIEYSSDQQRL